MTNVPSRTIYSVTETSAVSLVNAPPGVCHSVMALRDINKELHEHTNTIYGIKDLVLPQNPDVHVLAIKKLVMNKTIDNEIFPEDVPEFAVFTSVKKRNSYLLTKTVYSVYSTHPVNVHCTSVHA